jgi:hypothetical protein
VHEYGAVRLEDEEPYRLGQRGREAASVVDFGASDNEAHGPRTVLSISDSAPGRDDVTLDPRRRRLGTTVPATPQSARSTTAMPSARA